VAKNKIKVDFVTIATSSGNHYQIAADFVLHADWKGILIFDKKTGMVSRDEKLKLQWEEVQQKVSKMFGGGELLDVDAITFIIGVQELGQGYRTFKKDEKLDIMHIAICTLLEPYGYYTFDGRDTDLWPHYTLNQKLPALNHQQQQHLLKEGLLDYVIKNDYYHEIPESI
jgi:hypothetical protein